MDSAVLFAQLAEMIEFDETLTPFLLISETIKPMGYEKVELIDTTNDKFMKKSEASWMALSSSALLTGRK